MKTAIIIPARYASSRLPGKPLALIAGQTMLQRVVNIANTAIEGLSKVQILVATDDHRIVKHCQQIGARALMTSPEALTGTDRVAEAIAQIADKPDFILNLQGDTPLTPPDFIRAMIDTFYEHPCDVITPVTQLSWNDLDALRETKLVTPFSGTTAVFDQHSFQALWFSKNIIPAIRNEAQLRTTECLSPIFRHIGLYGYSLAMLERFVTLAESHFERLEGLEQLRILENGYSIRCVPVSYNGRANMSGIDSPEDIVRAEQLIKQHGELVKN